jgi:hypothetical protein
LRAGSASKIASHKIKAFLELGEALLEVFYVFGHVGSLYLANSELRFELDSAQKLKRDSSLRSE